MHISVRLLRVITQFDKSLSRSEPERDRKSLLPKDLLLNVKETRELKGLILHQIQVSCSAVRI